MQYYERFLDYLEKEKKYSPHTLVSYRKDLADFAQFLDIQTDQAILEVSRVQVRNFIVELFTRKMSKRSVNRKLSALRSLYTFLLRISAIETSPVEGINSLKFYKEKHLPLSQDEMNTLLSQYTKLGASPLERLIIELLYQTGMRRAELVGIQIKDIDHSQLQILVRGKGKKERLIPISPELSTQILEYQNEYLGISVAPEQQLLVDAEKNNVNVNFIYNTVNHYLGLITSKKKISPHILRHSFATHLLENGADISRVKKLMGHSSLASTQVYTHSDIEKLKKVVAKTHPRSF